MRYTVASHPDDMVVVIEPYTEKLMDNFPIYQTCFTKSSITQDVGAIPFGGYHVIIKGFSIAHNPELFKDFTYTKTGCRVYRLDRDKITTLPKHVIWNEWLCSGGMIQKCE